MTDIPTLDQLADRARGAGLSAPDLLLCLDAARAGSRILDRALVGTLGVLPPKLRPFTRLLALSALGRAIEEHLDEAQIAQAVDFAKGA